MRGADRRRATSTSSTSRAGALLCTCRGCYLLFIGAAPAAGASGRCPTATWPSPTCALTAAQWDALQIPVSVAFFFVNSASAGSSRFYPSPAGATESLLPLDAWADVVGANPGWRRMEPDVEALLVRAERGERRRVLPRARSTPATSWSGGCATTWRGFDGGAEARADARPRSSTACAGAPGPRPVVDPRHRRRHREPARVRGRRRRRRAVRGRSRRCCSGCASPRRPATPVHALALRCQIRIEPQRRLLRRDEEAPALRAVRRARRSGASRCARSCGPTSAPWSRASAGTHRGRPAGPCTYDFEVAAAKYLHALDDGESRSCCCSPAPSFVPGRRRVRGRARVVARRGVVPPARGHVAGRDGPLLPGQRRGSASAATRSTGCSGSRPTAPCADLGRDVRAPPQGSGAGEP